MADPNVAPEGEPFRVRKVLPWLLLPVLAVALALRAWGLAYDLPYVYHPDEPTNLCISLTMLVTGDLNPHHFNYPSLFYYLHLLAYGLWYAVGRVAGIWDSVGALGCADLVTTGVAYAPWPSVFLVGRAIALLVGLATVTLAYAGGKRLGPGVGAGLLAALLVALSPTNVSYSHQATPDIMVTLLALASYAASTRVYRRGEAIDYALAGLAVGLTAAVKYNGALAVSCLAAAHLLRSGVRDGRANQRLGVGAAAFLAASPFILIDYPTFRADLAFDAQRFATGHAGMEGDSLKWYLSYLWQAEGLVAVLAAAEVVRGIVRRSRETLLAAIFPVLYLAFISSFVVRNDRTLLLLIPFLGLLGGSLLARVFRAAATRPNAPLLLASMALLALTVLPPGLRAVRDDIRRVTVDSRETARVWINQYLPAGARLVVEAYSTYPDPQRFSVRGVAAMIEHPAEWYAAEGFDYLVFGEAVYGRYYRESERYAGQVAAYEALFRAAEPVRVFDDGGYEIRVYRVVRP